MTRQDEIQYDSVLFRCSYLKHHKSWLGSGQPCFGLGQPLASSSSSSAFGLLGMFAVPLLGSHPSEEEFGGCQRLRSHAPIYYESWCEFGLLSVLFMACHLGILFWHLAINTRSCGVSSWDDSHRPFASHDFPFFLVHMPMGQARTGNCKTDQNTLEIFLRARISFPKSVVY